MKTKYEVVISGMAGMFPESADVTQLKENLMRKINMVTNEEKKWKTGDLDVPIHTGKLPDSDAFDGMFFGLPFKHSDPIDPVNKRTLETAYGAVIDAGLNPGEISGTKTAVLSCFCSCDSEFEESISLGIKGAGVITGISKGMLSNRTSFYLNVTGPSLTLDESPNSFFDGIRYAKDNIGSGAIKAAIVTACCLYYLPESSFHFLKMGRLNTHGCTKCFSNDADGYSKSEGCVAIFLQRKEDAFRSYGTVLGVSDSSQLSKQSELTDISPGQYLPVLKQLYEDLHIDPASVAYVEAAGCASKIVDAEELNTIGELMLRGRSEPLPIGCIKSNLGNCDAAAGAVAVVKALFAADTGIIPPNIHYTTPNSMVPALKSGNLRVVTEPTPLTGEIIGINSISIIGSIKHLVIRQHDKVKPIEPKKGILPPDGIPRLFILSGRNQADLEQILDKVEVMPIDREFIALTHRVFKNGIKKHIFRAYTVLHEEKHQHREINEFFNDQKPEEVWFVFTGMGSQWAGMGKELMKLPKFAEAIEKCERVMNPHGINVTEIITSDNPKLFDNILYSFVGIAAIQIGLVDILHEIGIVPDGIIGHSVGELGCAYADGCLTAEQVILCAYFRGIASIESNLIPGLMAAVGKGYTEMKANLPESIDIACHNSRSNCTLSGPQQEMREYAKALEKEDVFVRLVNTGNIAYHSRYIKPAGSNLLQHLSKVIPEPKLRSKKWISTSVPETEWDTDLAKYCSAEYQTNNLLSSVFFEEASAHIPENATMIEIAPHGLLQPILKQCFPSACHIPLAKRGLKQGLVYLCEALGKAYIRGHSLDLEKLYPPVEYPVSRGTETLSNLITWDHSYVYKPLTYSMKNYEKDSEKMTATNKLTIDLEKKFTDLKDYQLHGVPVIPLGQYLEFGINDLKRRTENECNLVQLQNIKLLKYEDINGKCDLCSVFQSGTGNWQVCKNDEELVHGNIASLRSHNFPKARIVKGNKEPGTKFYERLNQLGLQIGPSFKLIKDITTSSEEISATVAWDGKLSNFLEAVLQIPLAACKDPSTLLLVKKVLNIVIDMDQFLVNETREFNVYFNSNTRSLHCDGLEMRNITTSPVVKRLNNDYAFFEPQLVHYEPSSVKDLSSYFALVQQIVCNNFMTGMLKPIDLDVLEVGEDTNFHSELYKAFQNVPQLNVYFKVIPDEVLFQVQEKEKYRTRNILVASASLSPQSALAILQHCKDGFILVKDQIVPSGLEIIMSKKIGNGIYSLCKKAENQNGKYTFVSLSSEDWESELQHQLNLHKERKVCLAGYVTHLPKMCNIIEKTSHFKNSHNIRYLFHDLMIESHQTVLFESQLSKGLKINILSQNKWSLISFKAISLPVQKLKRNNAFKFSQILCDKMDVKAIGLNPNETLGLHNEPLIVEYSGVEEGEDVCGIGTVDETSLAMKPDDVLKWKKPDNWSHEQIASVLLPYSLAYVMLKGLLRKKKEECQYFSNKILIHCGSFPLSQALINAAESEGFNVFTSYRDNIEKQLIKKLYPKIPDANIVSCETSNFCYSLLPKRNGELFSIIVSCLPEEEMVRANTLLLSLGGILYQTAFGKDTDSVNLGMSIFMKYSTVQGLIPSSLMLMSPSGKEEIRDCLENGFKSGAIKPLPLVTIRNDIDNHSAAELFKNSLLIGDRIVLAANGKSMKSSSLSFADDDGQYVIIAPSKEEGHLWIYILEWLISRGALNIHIVVDWNVQPEFIYEKFHQIIYKSSRCMINVENTEVLDTREKVRKFIAEIKQKSKLSIVFISSEEYSDKFNAICEASVNARIIYFTKELDETFNISSRNGLLVVDRERLLNGDILMSVIDSLVQHPRNFLIVSHTALLNSSIVVDDSWKKYNEHLPWTINEVVACREKAKTIGWKEVRTSSMRFQDSPGSIPVLFIPPIKKGQLDKLIKSLFSPAFQATIPSNIHSVLDLANQLSKEALKLQTPGFTLLCSDWSCSIGIQLGKLLESAGRCITHIFIQPLIQLYSPMLHEAVCQKISDEMNQFPISANTKELVQAGLELLKNRLELICSNVVNEEENKLQGMVVLVKNKFSSDYMSLELSKHSDNQIVIHNSDENSYLEMLNSKETAAAIHSAALVHYKDAAVTVPKTFGLKRFIENKRPEYLQRLVYDTRGKTGLTLKTT